MQVSWFIIYVSQAKHTVYIVVNSTDYTVENLVNILELQRF